MSMGLCRGSHGNQYEETLWPPHLETTSCHRLSDNRRPQTRKRGRKQEKPVKANIPLCPGRSRSGNRAEEVCLHFGLGAMPPAVS